MRRWLILDCNFLAWRAFYTTGGLTHHADPTGVVFGFLRGLNSFASQFGTTDFVFCFDHGRGWRDQQFSYYKEERRKKRLQEEEDGAIQNMRRQIDKLRLSYLEEIGHHNIFYRMGYEADDIMAQVVAGLDREDDAILISGDHDLYQLLSKRVSVYHPVTKETVTKNTFQTKFGIHPAQWPQVKAIAGCSSDEIPGQKGVGETTAAKFLAGELPKKAARYNDIVAWIESQQYRDNLLLVTLPYAGGPKPLSLCRPVPDGPRNANAWRELTQRLGMSSLADALDGDQSWRYAETCNAP